MAGVTNIRAYERHPKKKHPQAFASESLLFVSQWDDIPVARLW